MNQDGNQMEVSQLPSRVFAHIGHINLKTWHFGVFRLEETLPRLSVLPADVLILQPFCQCETADQKAVFSDYELFAHVLDMQAKWSIYFHVISDDPSHWASPNVETIATKRFAEQEEFIIWQGSSEEADRRRSLRKATRPTRGRGEKRSATTQPSSRTKKAARTSKRSNPSEQIELGADFGSFDFDFEPLQQSEPLMGLEDAGIYVVDSDIGIVDEGGQENDSNSEHENDIYDIDMYDEDAFIEEPENDNHKEDEECQQNLDLSECLGLDDQNPNNAANVEDDGDEKFLQEILLSENEAGEDELPELPSEIAVELPSQHDVPEAEERRIKKPSAGPVSRSTVNREVFAFPDGSEIHYYHLTGNMVAFCRHRNDIHAQGCRKSATTQPKRKGTGRPLGMLTAWLKSCDDHPNRQSHVHCCMPSFSDRVAGREFFQSLPNSDSFSRFEAAKPRDTDPDEPLTLWKSKLWVGLEEKNGRWAIKCENSNLKH